MLKRLRGKRTLEEFAGRIGAPKNTVWRWESGQTRPSMAYVKRLSRLAQQERFLADWKAVGSITWVGNLKEGSQNIVREFSRTLVRVRRSAK
jgi:transcriptional regulator with XRE-family HTH domain